MDTDTGVSTAADGWGAKARGALQQTTDRYRALGAYPDARRLIAAATSP